MSQTSFIGKISLKSQNIFLNFLFLNQKVFVIIFHLFGNKIKDIIEMDEKELYARKSVLYSSFGKICK